MKAYKVNDRTRMRNLDGGCAVQNLRETTKVGSATACTWETVSVIEGINFSTEREAAMLYLAWQTGDDHGRVKAWQARYMVAQERETRWARALERLLEDIRYA